MLKTDLSKYNNSHFRHGNFIIRIVWFIINISVFKSSLFPFNFIKVYLLKIFGAKIGKRVIIKPNINIKYPWNLIIGNHVWIGENVWIDSLDKVTIKDHSCISQGAMLLCGNHNYSSSSFDLITEPIILEEGVWIGAKSIVSPGIKALSHSVLSAGSVATKNLDAFSIYQGNPAIKIRDRVISK
tara:strand:+ start:115 stop:666 length:552 start_codon:yes stop_codon:yes gene_type:complete